MQCTVPIFEGAAPGERFSAPLAEEDFPEVMLPAATRSLELLGQLLSAPSVEVDLAAAVIAVDPALAFGTLQLACREEPLGKARCCRLPLAVVAAGRDGLQHLLEASPRIEGSPQDAKLRQLVQSAVQRALLAELLGSELLLSDRGRCFLAGLFFELPEIFRCGSTRSSDGSSLLKAMCRTLPSALVRAALTGSSEQAGPSDALMAVALIAEGILQQRAHSGGSAWTAGFAVSPLWRPWQGLNLEQRSSILRRCDERASWAGENILRLEPWKLLEQAKRGTAWN